jgi:hypothetical protein
VRLLGRQGKCRRNQQGAAGRAMAMAPLGRRRQVRKPLIAVPSLGGDRSSRLCPPKQIWPRSRSRISKRRSHLCSKRHRSADPVTKKNHCDSSMLAPLGAKLSTRSLVLAPSTASPR